ncbi:hypothetical protein ACFS7Z_11330 [Pontibacter toksunensis]|uniref:DKNYY family protein n=1 Tax=Pontibacter toksunensis TaxID=1332631 RepID=A0ABW6BVG7_9BACT
MYKKILSAVSVLLIQFTLSSCEKEVDITPVEQVVPLQVGNEWAYAVKDYDTHGNLLTTSSYAYTVRKDTTIDNSTWYILSDNRIVQNSRDGYVYYNEAGKQPVMIYPGTSFGEIGYMYKYQDYDLTVLTSRSQQMDTVEVFSESYASYLFKIENKYKAPTDVETHIITEHNYVSPGIGLVRTDIYYVDSEKIRQRRELVSYTLH